MSELERTLIAVASGYLLGQLAIIIYYVAFADRPDRRRRRVRLPQLEEWRPESDPPEPFIPRDTGYIAKYPRPLEVWSPASSRQVLRMDPGQVVRGNGKGGPTTQRPRIIPRGTRSITFPDPDPGRQPTNPFNGEPVKPQFPPPRIIRDNFLP